MPAPTSTDADTLFAACRRQASSSTERHSGATKLTISERRMPLMGRLRNPCQLVSEGMKMKPIPLP
ncbi:hypothetical protein M2319_003177 [Rhodobium gokarnense]|uniref:Uncharacterized protein n=1 Tax=Rhodobium gokarnense TaxID=364296 RepID=A0ABT3HEI6_9HYPH|nr:hypothetical protein [Rhodobium gokarnense]